MKLKFFESVSYPEWLLAEIGTLAKIVNKFKTINYGMSK